MSTSESLFELNDLPNGWWSVGWNRDRWYGIYTPRSHIRLLKLVFEELGGEQIGLSVSDYLGKEQVLYISAALCQELGYKTVADQELYNQNVQSVCFPTQPEAEQFKLWLEKKYFMKLLSHDYNE